MLSFHDTPLVGWSGWICALNIACLQLEGCITNTQVDGRYIEAVTEYQKSPDGILILGSRPFHCVCEQALPHKDQIIQGYSPIDLGLC